VAKVQNPSLQSYKPILAIDDPHPYFEYSLSVLPPSLSGLIYATIVLRISSRSFIANKLA